MRIALLLALAGLPQLGWAEIYKWVDEKGVTHYTATPPPSGKAERLKTPAQAPAGSGSAPAAKSWQEKEIEFRQRRVEEEAQQQKEAASAARAAALRRACIAARVDLENLRMQRPIYRVDQRGERRFIEDKERAELIRKTEQAIQKDCPPH
jgi:hypothetical protein